MRTAVLRLTAAAVAAAAAVLTFPGVATASPPVVFPGMEIIQNTNVCTLGFVDPALRIAYTAGHCRGSGPVVDRDGHLIGAMALYKDTMVDGAVIEPNDFISDYEVIALADGVDVNNVLPGGRRLESDPGVVAGAGQRVCHFGISTGESCGTIASINNGWFTMNNGVVSQKGDSGGPVFVDTGNGRAVIVGLFNSTWGDFPAAVSWQATNDQVRRDAPGAIAAAAPSAPVGGPPGAAPAPLSVPAA
ncbi:S1 family peptidase [Mycobacterium sp. MYCO198283]|uniref:Rv1815 family serine proteinase n=1 Tax=Mycobacterium sp. MYCO198283 TaxID=2883505 RepID=UPI001E2B5BAB|nr:S1 family peptidase [Mycobacterium sp. MYCO198283]MCG5433177.1 S1 family peptidase [Mycobacterium sp. MYCO198283]